MSLESILENLRSKPEHMRKRYAFGTAFVITAIIFTFWINSFGVVRKSTSEQLASVVDRVESPGKNLVASVGGFLVDIKDIVFGPKKVEYSTVEVKPGKR